VGDGIWLDYVKGLGGLGEDMGSEVSIEMGMCTAEGPTESENHGESERRKIVGWCIFYAVNVYLYG
jgi:hypothetical protein